jgi:hypothetical protein
LHFFGLLAGTLTAAGYEIRTTHRSAARTQIAAFACVLVAAAVIAGLGWPPIS